ncbi:hypothetical protein KEM54_001566, partial [Ascosphaera aggregata]
MPPTIPSLTTVIVAAVLVYLTTFVVLAILRVATGISVQRVGYLSLNHVAFSPRDGVSIWIRIIGVSFHRPSVAQPTWMSIRIGETRITVNLKILAQEKEASRREAERNAAAAAAAAAAAHQEKGASARDNKKRRSTQQMLKVRQQQQQQKEHHQHYHHARNVSSVSTTTPITYDLPEKVVGTSSTSSRRRARSLPSSRHDRQQSTTSASSSPLSPFDAPSSHSKLCRQLCRIRNVLRKLHRYVNYLALVDIYATDTTLQILDAGEVHVGSFRLRVDTRKKVFEQGRLFRAQKSNPNSSNRAEWMFLVRRVLASVEGFETVELLDSVSLNIRGILSQNAAGLDNVGVATKVGRLHVPCEVLKALGSKIRALRGDDQNRDVGRDCTRDYDEETSIFEMAKRRWNQEFRHKDEEERDRISEASEEFDEPSDEDNDEARINGRHDNAMNGCNPPHNADLEDTRAIIFSVLNGLQEIQIGLSFVRVTRLFGQLDNNAPLYLTIVTHEMALDVHQIERRNPAHKMYFQPNDIAHQALLAAMSCSVSFEDETGLSDRVMYIPMTTMTIKTTLPSRIASFMQNPDVHERNSNVLFANLVVTSPAVDLEPKHISHMVHLLQSARRPKTRQAPSRKRNFGKDLLASHLLPKASIKTSIQEPVLRFIIPVRDDGEYLKGRSYHLLVSSVSSASFDIETIHTSKGHYTLSANYRVVSHLLYYHTAGGSKCRLLTIDSFNLRTHVNATPEIAVAAHATINTFSIHLQSGEVSHGIIQIMHHYVDTVHVSKPSKAVQVPQPKFLRRLPHWLLQFQLEVTAFSVEVAGIDQSLGPTTRGLVMQLQECSADYQSQKQDLHKYARGAKRRTPSYSATSEENALRFTSTSSSARRQNQLGATDGRRLVVHVKNLEGFIIESAEFMEQESFLALPRFEVSLNTSSDLQGPIFHINTSVKSIYLSYSLYRHYAVSLALCVLNDVFKRPFQSKQPRSPAFIPEKLPAPAKAEKLTLDIKIVYLQVKASMPADPPLMLQVYTLAAGSYRWSPPFVRCALLQLHAGAPKMKGVWARIASMSNLRVGFRQERKVPNGPPVESPDIYVTTDFVRLAVPHLMVVHHVFDNFVNVGKASKQLHHRFTTRTNEYILEKSPEKPKIVPHINVRSKALLFELEDDAFEYKLSRIYRLGLLEQRHRLAREEAFQLKLRKLDDSKLKQARETRGRTMTATTLQPPSHKHKKNGETGSSGKRSKSTDAVPKRPATPKRSRSESVV